MASTVTKKFVCAAMMAVATCLATDTYNAVHAGGVCSHSGRKVDTNGDSGKFADLGTVACPEITLTLGIKGSAEVGLEVPLQGGSCERGWKDRSDTRYVCNPPGSLHLYKCEPVPDALTITHMGNGGCASNMIFDDETTRDQWKDALLGPCVRPVKDRPDTREDSATASPC